MRFRRGPLSILLLMVLTGSQAMGIDKALVDQLTPNTQEISHSAVPTPDDVKREVFEAATAELVRHVNLDPDGISTALYRSSQTRIHVQWKGFRFASFQPATIMEADRLNGVTANYWVNFGTEAYRTWKTGDKGWTQWKASRYKTFVHGIRVQKVKGRWTAKRTPQLGFFSPGPGSASITKQAPTKAPNLPPGVTPR